MSAVPNTMRFVDPTEDPWRPSDHASGEPIPARGHLLLTLEQWQSRGEAWPAQMPVGVILPNTADVESFRAELPSWALVALQFPKWTDGRAYSQAHLLRVRLRFGGEVRAVGEVLVDMLPLLQRSGFDAVQLRADQNMATAIRALRYFASHYQGDVIEARPAFARLGG